MPVARKINEMRKGSSSSQSESDKNSDISIALTVVNPTQPEIDYIDSFVLAMDMKSEILHLTSIKNSRNFSVASPDLTGKRMKLIQTLCLL